MEFSEQFPHFFNYSLLEYLIIKPKKSWNKTYKSIENKLLDFYPELNCKISGKRPTVIDLLKNYGTERIEFKFNKAHLAVTNDSIYVFPYDSAELKERGINYDFLEEPFRIIYNPKEKKDKYSIISTVSEFISMKSENGKTDIELKTAKLKNETKLIFDREITIANNV